MAVIVRDETPADATAVREVITRAFGRPAEASLVDALRGTGKAIVALVAEQDGHVVGHVLFMPVTLAGAPLAAGLAPLAVLPETQRQGIGAALVRAGLARCRADGRAFVVVLGSPAYYGRFGFAAAAGYALRCEYDAPPGAFQVLELIPGAVASCAGVVRYAPEFAMV